MSLIDTMRSETNDRMSKTVDNLKKDLSRVRTGRASPSLLEAISVDYYGSPVPVNQIANISVPEARLIVIQPWEKSMLGTIEKAIQASDLGLNPKNDGNVLRVPIPALTEERRKDLFKHCKKTAEDCKVAVRNIRRDGNDKVKKSQKDKSITEDEEKKIIDEVQKLTDKYIKSIDDLLAVKEKEIMEV
jgi:ribosome recycling factor